MKLTTEKAREMQAKGVPAFKEKAAKRRAAQEDMRWILTLSLRKGELAKVQDIEDLITAEAKNITVMSAINLAMAQRAIMGDVQAAIYCRDTAGDKPTDKIQLDQSLTIEEWAKKHKVKL